MSNDQNKKVKAQLDEVSPSFCLAKWLQVTLHLQNGRNHSCHHPIPHQPSLQEVQANYKAIHNSKFKKAQRQAMLNGKRPEECDYCWRIEDSSPDNFSDRIHKSSESWALPELDRIKSLPWDADVNPTYLEVSFGNECNFKCAYCSPWVSSAILTEFQKHGPYKQLPGYSYQMMKDKESPFYLYGKDEFNPYVDAFWKWWPELSNDLKVFRITGGEPLLNPNTFQFLESIIKDPKPQLEVAINSNLGVPDVYINKFINYAKNIKNGSTVKHFQLFTSLDTSREQAEFIRFGLNYDTFFKNLHKILNELPDLQIIFMCTYNVMSVPRFRNFLQDIKEIKKMYKNPYGKDSRVQISIPYLRYPNFLAANILPKSYLTYVEESLDYMLRNSLDEDMIIFDNWEIEQLRRIYDWLKNENIRPDVLKSNQLKFFDYIEEYAKRKNLDFLKTFPEFHSLYTTLKNQNVESDS